MAQHHVIDRKKAKVGVFITLAEPTGPMRTEAVKAGFYETDYGKFPKIQLSRVVRREAASTALARSRCVQEGCARAGRPAGQPTPMKFQTETLPNHPLPCIFS